MGSSAKKKREKKQDFQKPKHKVGKAKPKPSNFTDTSFRSKAIVMAHQSLSTDAPDKLQQFKHNLSLAASSKSEQQRRDALSYLTGQLSMEPPYDPVGPPTLLERLLPLILDRSNTVRSQLLKLCRAIPVDGVRHHTEQILRFVRAGMTHLSTDISNTTLGFIDWLLDVAADELVACPGGWVRTLNCFLAMMGWSAAPSQAGWSSSSRSTSFAGNTQTQARQITILGKFLQAGFKPEELVTWSPMGYWNNLYRIPRDPHVFDYLNLTGPPRSEEDEMYSSREERQGIFHKRFLDPVSKNAEQAKKGGGAVGRAAAALDQILVDGMQGFEPSNAWTTQDLLDLW